MASGRPCGACKLLRKKCLENCLFAPHFSADETGVDQFRSIQKVLGHSHFAKLLQQLPVEQRHGAVASLLYEAQARLRDPVHGCISIINALQQENGCLKWQNENLRGQYENLRKQNECLKEQLARTRPQLPECQYPGSRNIQIADYTNDNQSRTPYSMPSGYQEIAQQNQQYSVWEDHQSAMPQNQYAVQSLPPPAAAAEGPSCFPSCMHRGVVSNLVTNPSVMEQRDAGMDLGDFHSSQDVWKRLSRASRTL
eukprot:PITA_28685